MDFYNFSCPSSSFVPTQTTFRFRISSSPLQLRFPGLFGCKPFGCALSLSEKLKEYGLRKFSVTAKASGPEEHDSQNGFSMKPKKLFMEERPLSNWGSLVRELVEVYHGLHSHNGIVLGLSANFIRLTVNKAIGAEYGEGFETFRPNGPLKVDVDFLNDRMQESGLQRIRYAMKPDEAFGLIFSWDNVVVDTRALKLDAWNQLASEEGQDVPKDSEIQRSMLYAGADHVLRKVLCWEKGKEELERLKLRLSQIYYENLLNVEAPIEGLKEWLDALYTAGIPCAVVSCLDRQNLLGSLQRMGLRKYFQAVVTEEDGMESLAQRFLSAAVKLDRKPSKCVVFEDDPRGITAAHNCTMMAIALIGSHPAYELDQADLAVASFSELSVINLRRLFAHKGSAFMDLQKQIENKAPPKRKLYIDTIF